MKEFETDGLEVYVHNGKDYEPTMHFDAWRVAFLNYANRFDVIDKLERHILTDEVFVLLEGDAILIVGEDCKTYRLEKNKIYNVKAAVWHAIKVTENARVLIFENHNTSKDNSEYLPLGEPLALSFN